MCMTGPCIKVADATRRETDMSPRPPAFPLHAAEATDNHVIGRLNVVTRLTPAFRKSYHQCAGRKALVAKTAVLVSASDLPLRTGRNAREDWPDRHIDESVTREDVDHCAKTLRFRYYAILLMGDRPDVDAARYTAGAGQDLSATGHAITNSAEQHKP